MSTRSGQSRRVTKHFPLRELENRRMSFAGTRNVPFILRCSNRGVGGLGSESSFTHSVISKIGGGGNIDTGNFSGLFRLTIARLSRLGNERRVLIEASTENPLLRVSQTSTSREVR